MEKKFLPPFTPPRLVRARARWYIEWYEKNPMNGQMQRIRQTFGLNRIKKKSTRKKQADMLLNRIYQTLLEQGAYYFHTGVQASGHRRRSLQAALEKIEQIKYASVRKASRNSYASIVRRFRTWCADHQYLSGNVEEFSRAMAVAYLDEIRMDSRVGARSFNNHLSTLRSFFAEMLQRDWIQANPFAGIRRQRVKEKNRRCFTTQEAAAVVEEAQRQNCWLLRAILLQYYGFIRPKEIRWLKFGYFEQGLVHLPGKITKTGRARSVTLPQSIRSFFSGDIFESFPSTYFLFGPGIRPGPARPCGKNAFNMAHGQILKALEAKGKIADRSGLSFYSWKDSGITDLSREVPLLSLMKQAGHQDPNETVKYYDRRRTNKDMAGVQKKLF